MGVLKRFVAIILLVHFTVMAPSRATDTSQLPVDPNDPRLNFLNLIKTLRDIDYRNPIAWLMVSAAIAAWEFRNFTGSIREGWSNYEKLKKELDNFNLSAEARSRLIGELDLIFSRWTAMESKARNALAELEAHLRIPESDRGGKWQKKYERLMSVVREEVQQAYREALFRTNRLFETGYLQIPQTDLHMVPQNGAQTNGQHLNHHRERIETLGQHVGEMRARCQEIASQLAEKRTVLRQDLRLRNFIKWPLIHLTATGVAIGAGVYSWNAFFLKHHKTPEQLKNEVAKKNQMDLRREIDLRGQIQSETGQKDLSAFNRVVKEVLKTHKVEILKSLKSRLENEELLDLEQRGLTIEKLVDYIDSDAHIQLAIESALAVAGKNAVGDGGNLTDVMNYLYPSRMGATDPKVTAIRDIGRPKLIRAFYGSIFNELWPNLSKVGAGKRIIDPIYDSLEKTTIEKLEQSKSRTSAPAPTTRLEPDLPKKSENPPTPAGGAGLN